MGAADEEWPRCAATGWSGTRSRVPPDLCGGDQQDDREGWKQDPIGNDPEQQPPDEGSDNRPGLPWPRLLTARAKAREPGFA